MSREEKKEKEKESVLVISISSTSSSSSYGEEEEEEEEVEVRSAEEKGRDDDECCILPSDPFADDLILNLSLCQRNDDGDDLAILFVRGQVACRDLPHQRNLCAEYPFSKTPHESYCPKCFCYVCEKIAPCEAWKGPLGHCHATDQEKKWKDMRKAQQSAQAQEIKPCSGV
ncbi:uncharacterized protein LOC109713937 [Ananas comosus]|uniref:Uncharacterized protein LOC109713937 n=2 Tax=Ananas comosus TaxID=4615 RepID=A0A6P5FDW8_ANACO|nr:uncharacterized protein LOC109713937 [Ananas comosus]